MEKESPQGDQEEFRRVLADLREAQSQIESLQAQTEVLSDQMQEIENTMETLEGMEEVEEGTEILVPIGSGSYIPAEVKDPNKILSDIGAGLVAERTPKKVMDLVERWKSDLEESQERIQERIEELNEKVEELRPKAQQLLARRQAGGEEISG